MRLTIDIPVRKIQVGPCATSFEFEPRDCEVIAVSRTRSGGRGWHHTVHVVHPDIHAEYPRTGVNGSYARWLRRASYPKWKPPVFPNDKHGTVMITGEDK